MIRTVFFLGVALFAFSCVRQIDDLKFVPLTPEAGVPVGTFTLKANNLTKIGDSINVDINDQGVIQFYFESEVFNASMIDRLSLPNQSFNETVPFSSFVFLGGTDNKVVLSQYNSFTLSNTDLPSPPPELQKLIFKAGTLRITQSKDFDHQLETTITFPTFTKNGNPISVVLNNNNSFSTTLDLAELDLTGASGTSSNTIDYEVSAVVSNTGTDTQGTVTIDFSMENMAFSYVMGDLKTYLLGVIDDSYDVTIDQSQLPGGIGFTNPILKIGVVSSTGIPFGLDINDLTFTKSDGTNEKVTGTYDDQTIMISAPTVPGEISTTDYIIDKNNTDNFVSLLNNIPRSVYFKGDINANPVGTPAEGNFITDSSNVIINTRFTLPLEGYANNYALADTIDANLDLDENGVVTLNNINLRLNSENNFPLDIGLQLYFLDKNNNTIILDSLFIDPADKQVISAAQVDNTGLVISPTFMSVDIPIDRNKYEGIRNTGSIRILASLFTPGADGNPPSSIKISEDNYLKLAIGIKAQAYIDPNNAN